MQKRTYEAELEKLDQLEKQYWQRWKACDQAERRNAKYLDGLRWCMSHRLKLLSKLEKLDKMEPGGDEPKAEPVRETPAGETPPSNKAATKPDTATGKRPPKQAEVIRRGVKELKRSPQPTPTQQLIARAMTDGVRVSTVLLPKEAGQAESRLARARKQLEKHR